MVSVDRMTGYRVRTGDDAALAAPLVHLFAAPDEALRAMGGCGRAWVTAQFDPATVAEQALALDAAVAPDRVGR